MCLILTVQSQKREELLNKSLLKEDALNTIPALF